MNPKISIIVPCYKQSQYLEDSLLSILEQTYINWECIIVNDGSPDDTEKVAQIWVKKDVRFKYLFQQNRGVSNARNNGINLAMGEYILPIDADDKIENNYVAECLNAIENSKDIKVVYGKVKNFGIEEGEILSPQFEFQNLIFSNSIHCSGVFLKSDWLKIMGYDENMIHGYEDWEFWINLLKSGGVAKEIDATHLFYRRKNVSRMTKINLKNGYDLRAYIIFKHHELYKNYLNDISRKVNINFSYSYYLSAKKYTSINENVHFAKKQYLTGLNNLLENYTFIQRKKILFGWYSKGKLNLTLFDVLFK